MTDAMLEAARRLVRLEDEPARVLLVDDDHSLLDGLRRGLHREPFNLYLAAGAQEALDVLEAVDIAVVVSDQQMPEIDGLHLLARVRQSWPETVRIMLTGNASLDVAMQAVNSGGIHRFLVKPLPTASLAVALRDSVRHHRVQLVARELLAQCRELSRALVGLGESRQHEHDHALNDLERFLDSHT